MPRSLRLGRLLGLAGVTVWLGLPASLVPAQFAKSRPGAGPTEKAPPEDKGPPRISVLRLQVVKPDPGQPDGPAGFPRRNRFGLAAAPREGTSLTFTLDEPEQWILDLKADDCKITRFRDDKDTDLAPAAIDPAGGGMPFGPRPGQEEGPISVEVDPTGHRATVTVHSPRLPTGGANRLLLDAVLVVRYGRGERTVEQKNVNLKVDKLTVGPIPMVVFSPDAAGPGRGMIQGESTQVTLFHHRPLREIKKVAFIGPDGNEILTSRVGWGQNGSTYQTSYSLARKVETCTVRFTVPETIETVHMAVAINTSVGFHPFVTRRILPATEPRTTATGAAPQ
jgi:hypothetical protein